MVRPPARAPFSQRLAGRRLLVCLSLLSILTAGSGCSLRTYAINTVGDALASGNSVYETDDDIELVGSALPFGLKLTESLLAQSPIIPACCSRRVGGSPCTHMRSWPTRPSC